MNGWQTYGLTGAGITDYGYMHPRKLDPGLAPISTALGVLGMLGLTAYAGLVVQCQPKMGETVLVTAASGGVGQCVGQIARIMGCRVVGIAGAEEKCRFVEDELRFDACISRLDPDFPQLLKKACPDGVDVYFENVGGPVFEAALPLLNSQARVSLCGLISAYGDDASVDIGADWFERGAATFAKRDVDVKRLFVGDYVTSHQDVFLGHMSNWVRSGEVVYREHRWPGLAEAPHAFSQMLKGGNFGKSLVVVSPDPTQ